MPDNNDTEIIALAIEIGRYLADHPDAADTLHGIVEWWLLKERYKTSMENVHAALEYLMHVGRIAKTELADGTVVYVNKKPEAKD